MDFFLFRDQHYFWGIDWHHIYYKVTNTYIGSHRYFLWYRILWYLLIWVIQFQHHFDISTLYVVSQMWNCFTNVSMHHLHTYIKFYMFALLKNNCSLKSSVSYWISISTISFYNICRFSNGKYIFNLIICFSNKKVKDIINILWGLDKHWIDIYSKFVIACFKQPAVFQLI